MQPYRFPVETLGLMSIISDREYSIPIFPLEQISSPLTCLGASSLLVVAPKNGSDVYSIYATSVWLSLAHDHSLVLLLFADLLVTVGSTAIPTSNFIFKHFYLSCIYMFAYTLFLTIFCLLSMTNRLIILYPPLHGNTVCIYNKLYIHYINYIITGLETIL